MFGLGLICLTLRQMLRLPAFRLRRDGMSAATASGSFDGAAIFDRDHAFDPIHWFTFV
jgi:hypothetical protein